LEAFSTDLSSSFSFGSIIWKRPPLVPPSPYWLDFILFFILKKKKNTNKKKSKIHCQQGSMSFSSIDIYQRESFGNN
jgi:hypothetical protein